jgi:hypothetical protein
MDEVGVIIHEAKTRAELDLIEGEVTADATPTLSQVKIEPKAVLQPKLEPELIVAPQPNVQLAVEKGNLA